MSILTHIASQWVLACFVLVDQRHAFCTFAHVWLLFMVVCFGSSWTFKGSGWLPHSHAGPVGPLCLQLPISWQAEGAVLWLAALGLEVRDFCWPTLLPPLPTSGIDCYCAVPAGLRVAWNVSSP